MILSLPLCKLYLAIKHSTCIPLMLRSEIRRCIQIINEELQKSEYNLKKMKHILVTIAALLVLTTSLACEQGSIANPLSICISPNYIEGCNQYLTENTCKTCNYRYALQTNGLCELDKDTTEDCCSLRASDNSCIKCQTGLYLISGKCQQSNIIGCLEKDSRGVCLNCATGYYIKDGCCSKAIKNCASYADNSMAICTDCNYGFSLINNICVRNSVLGCKKEVSHICRECYKPFVLSNGNCDITNCKTYNEYKCVACNCGYFLTAEGVCKANELGCIRYQRGQCTDCLPNFKLKGSKCDMEGCKELGGMQCKKCDQAYDLVEGVCKMKNCLTWKDGSCEVCQQGFNYQAGSCISSKVVTLQ